jgi:hypothetical protein
MLTKNLKDTTFIIPLTVEHPDRYRNSKVVLGFLNHHFNTNVFIYEISDTGETELDFLDTLDNLNIKHWVSKPEMLSPNPDLPIFHRTKYLNLMLDEVETPVVVNYDIDVILRPEVYERCQELIVNNRVDVIYPFKFGIKGQIRVLEKFDYDRFINEDYNFDVIHTQGPMNYYDSEYGHCIFFNTQIYRMHGGENENFISYGPEDKERGLRFQKIGSRVEWMEDSIVYHFEHFRGNDSGNNNPLFHSNWNIFNNLEKMDGQQLFDYYNSADYHRNYKTICK